MEFNLGSLSSDVNRTQRSVKVLILGSGPAGLTAALYAARAELSPIVLTGMDLGGQVSLTHIVENYPGFPEGVGGTELVELFQKQAERFGAEVVFDLATSVDLSKRPFKIVTDNGEYLADTLILCTGATPLHLLVPGETEFTGRGVSYCGTCDGWFFKDKEVVVVGGGDSAIEEGLFLTRYANSVTIIHRRDSLRAGAILQSRASEEPKLKYIWNTIVTDIVGNEKVDRIRIKNVVSGAVDEMPIDGVFIFIGHKPNTQLFVGQLALDDRGYIKTGVNMSTNIPGVFVAGEVGDSMYRQVITSAGMGAAAAMQAIRFLESHN